MSDQSLASIGIQITSNAGTAAQDLDKLVGAGTQADAVVNKLGTTSKDAAAQVANVGAAAKTLGAAQSATNQTIKAATISSAQYAQSLRLLPIQIHQGFDQLLYGTNPLIVLSTQLPQISESFGGLGNALKAFGSIVTPTVLGIGTLAAAIGTVGYAWYEAAAEQDAFRKSLITSGNAVGLTVSQLETMRKAIEDSGGVTRGNAATALTTAISGGITGNIEQVAKLAAQIQQLGGPTIAQTIKEFAALGDDPVKASESLEKSLAFLTPEIYDQIAALESQGKTAAAAALAQKSLSDALSDQVTQLKASEGDWSRFWNAVKGGASGALEAIGKIVDPSTAEQIASLTSRIQKLQSNPGTAFFGASQIIILQHQLDALNAQVAAAAAKAQAEAKNRAAAIETEFTTSLVRPDQSAAFAAGQQAQSLGFTAQSDQIQRALQGELAATQRYDQLLDAEHSAHLISDQAYYDAKRKAIDADTQDQASALQKQIALLQRQNASIQESAEAFAEFHQGPSQVAQVTENWSKANADLHANNQKILDDQAKLNQLTDDAASKVKLLGIEQMSAAKQAKQALDNLVASENQYLETLQRNYQLQLQGLTAGPTEKQRLQDLSQVDAQALQQRQSLDQAKRINPELPNYDAQLQAIEQAHQKAIADTNAYYDALDKYQSDWLTGAKGALSTYEESAKDVSEQVGTLFTDTFQGMEDTFVNFAQTGKLSFKSLADSIIGDIARIVAKQEAGGIANLFSSILPFSSSIDYGAAADSAVSSGFTLGSLPGFASGGQVTGPSIVGEKGPELFIPDTSGYVVPNDKLQAMGGAPTFNFSYNFGNSVNTVTRAELYAATQQMGRQTVAQVSNLIKGGAYRK